jgi:hypothetical protein
MINVKLVAIVAFVAVAAMMMMTALALQGLIPASAVEHLSSIVVGALVGWLVPQPKKETQE